MFNGIPSAMALLLITRQTDKMWGAGTHIVRLLVPMEATDDVSYQKLLSNAWELRQTITRLTASLQDPQYSKNDKEELEIALKATVAALRDVHKDFEKTGAQVPFYTWALVDETKIDNPAGAKARDVPRREVF